jgi:hypothetical protein
MTDATTQAAMIDALAKAIYCHKGALPAPWDCRNDQWSELRMEAESQAAAVLALVGPKPLVWSWRENIKAWVTPLPSDFTIYEQGDAFYLCPPSAKREPHPTIEAAQAAAQAHADAAHWSDTGLGDLINATHTSQNATSHGILPRARCNDKGAE